MMVIDRTQTKVQNTQYNAIWSSSMGIVDIYIGTSSFEIQNNCFCGNVMRTQNIIADSNYMDPYK